MVPRGSETKLLLLHRKRGPTRLGFMAQRVCCDE